MINGKFQKVKDESVVLERALMKDESVAFLLGKRRMKRGVKV